MQNNQYTLYKIAMQNNQDTLYKIAMQNNHYTLYKLFDVVQSMQADSLVIYH